jgi:dTDP-4-amino-4,6-dideoxygalactose transaminase
MTDFIIPFHKARVSGREQDFLGQMLRAGRFDSDGDFSRQCEAQLRQITGCETVLLTPSCTDALEMAALLCDIRAGDEVIMPSFTFVSSANPFVLRGARIVFVDVAPATMNIDPDCAARAITPKTRAMVVMHYGGVAADMNRLTQLAAQHDLFLIEDAAHGIGAQWQGKHPGTIGHLGALSFHSTKNIHCGEGGALLVNDARLAERAYILRDKGTNRRQYLLGETGLYNWVDVGSSFTLSELNAAFLLAQLDDLDEVNAERRRLWNLYRHGLSGPANAGQIELPFVPSGCVHNAHIFYLKCKSRTERTELIEHLSAQGIDARFHYVPLHSAPAGLQYGRFEGEDRFTTSGSERLLRLPLYPGLQDAEAEHVLTQITAFFNP